MRVKSWGFLMAVFLPVAGVLTAAGNDLFFGEVKVYSMQGATASGEPFNDSALTAAHRSLPFGTRVRVVNLENNRQVDLRINDRIRDKGSLLLTLTRAAAARISLSSAGQARVEMTVLGVKKQPAAGNGSPGTGTPQTGNPVRPPDNYRVNLPADGSYTLQVGAFRRRDYAVRLSAKLTGLGYPSRVQDGSDGFYRVIVGPYATRDAAVKVRSALAGETPGAFIRKKD